MECIRCRINWTDAEKLHVPEPPSTLSEIFKVQIYYKMAVEKPIGENMIYIKTKGLRKGMKICFCKVGGS